MHSHILSHKTEEGVVLCIAVIFKIAKSWSQQKSWGGVLFAEDNHKASPHCYFKSIRGAIFAPNEMYLRLSWNLDHTPLNVFHRAPTELYF